MEKKNYKGYTFINEINKEILVKNEQIGMQYITNAVHCSLMKAIIFIRLHNIKIETFDSKLNTSTF